MIKLCFKRLFPIFIFVFSFKHLFNRRDTSAKQKFIFKNAVFFHLHILLPFNSSPYPCLYFFIFFMESIPYQFRLILKE